MVVVTPRHHPGNRQQSRHSNDKTEASLHGFSPFIRQDTLTLPNSRPPVKANREGRAVVGSCGRAVVRWCGNLGEAEWSKRNDCPRLQSNAFDCNRFARTPSSETRLSVAGDTGTRRCAAAFRHDRKNFSFFLVFPLAFPIAVMLHSPRRKKR